jgi:Holliday junction DNA helicase RuvA
VIGSLRGTVVEHDLHEVLVEVAGVGYRVTVSPSTVVRLGEVGTEVFLYVHHHLREDAQTLYGFLTRDERSCFEALLGAHGVGPALALAILSVHEPDALRRVLLDEDVAALCLVPGVGRKTAQRLLVELTSRLGVPEPAGAATSTVPGAGRARSGPAAGAAVGDEGRASTVAVRADVREALLGLGYEADEVLAVLRDLPETGDPAALLREALQRMAGGPSGGGKRTSSGVR